MAQVTANDKYNVVMYLWYQELHEASICPYNHDLGYSHGWFYYDDRSPHRNTKLTAEADELLRRGCRAHWRYEGMRDIPELECPEEEEGEDYE